MHLKNYCFAEYCLSAILKICAYKKYKIINVLIFFWIDWFYFSHC